MDVEKSEKRKIPELPPIRTDEDVREEEPNIRIGRKKASLPPLVPLNTSLEDEKKTMQE